MLTLTDELHTYSPATPKPRVPCLDESNRYHAQRCNPRHCQAPFTEACRTKVGAKKPEQRQCQECGETKELEEFEIYHSGARGKACLDCRRRQGREREAAKRQAKKGVG